MIEKIIKVKLMLRSHECLEETHSVQVARALVPASARGRRLLPARLRLRLRGMPEGLG